MHIYTHFNTFCSKFYANGTLFHSPNNPNLSFHF
nr:MAG TPA: hypothetical protein [Herelleviridae sp.]